MKKLIIAGLGAMIAMAGMVGSAYAEQTTIKLCTGGAGGPYNEAGKMIADAANGNPKIKIEVVETSGSVENIRLTTDATDNPGCHAFIGQPDAVVLAKRASASLPVKQIAQLHREYLQVLCSKASEIDDIEDLPGSKHTVNIGPEGSGAWAIWQNFIAEDESYKDVPTKNDNNDIALGSVATDETTCMLVPAGLNHATLKEANDNYYDDVALVEATDWDFNDALDIRGKPLYEFVDIPRTYKNLQGFFGGKRETVSWLAGVYVNPSRIPDDKALGEFIKVTNRAKAAIVAQYGK